MEEAKQPPMNTAELSRQTHMCRAECRFHGTLSVTSYQIYASERSGCGASLLNPAARHVPYEQLHDLVPD